MMNETIKGSVQNIAGRVQDAVGGLTGDGALQAEGKTRQAAGNIQKSYGEALDTFREAALNNPAATIAVVAGVAFMLGALWARRD